MSSPPCKGQRKFSNLDRLQCFHSVEPTCPVCKPHALCRERGGCGSADTRLTREDVVAGTPQYLAPETIRDGANSDPRSDLYALGAVAYYLLTATPVFVGRPIAVIQSHLNASPEPPSSRLGRPLPAKLERVVLDCLEKDPTLRPESAQALADRLAACDDVEPWDAEEARRWWRARKTA
jgi:serine/threonine protein kinase